ncbi:30562_t:CDS:2 [Gigaspora margarita]|uniref:30562_t:CDS:1 n=1 Tax=Gigaspora margarita TaxID=4874 RepID=A0ABN7WDA0_GIGMA|nr:30562_t:CDS:2 [Gigaspora margarita]
MSALTCKLKCLICQKEFETNCRFLRYNNTICKLNKLLVEQKKIPVLIITKIKDDIVYSIHRRLGKNSENTGLQAVSLTCPESISRCIFRSSTEYQELSNILNDVIWGVKYYLQSQKTYVQLTPHDISQDQHPLIRRVKEEAAIGTVKNSKKQVRKLRYPHGEVIIEWREKKDIDSKKNICQTGFIYIHFFTGKKYFQN